MEIEKIIEELEQDLQYCKVSNNNEDEISMAKETIEKLKKALNMVLDIRIKV